MLNATCTAPHHRPTWPRKIQLNGDLYSPHSVRASAGNADCDHDFEAAPTVRHADFAVWNCTRCGRAFKYETWKSGRPTASKESLRPLQGRSGDVRVVADGSLLLCDPATF
jgi:hypothetical protein